MDGVYMADHTFQHSESLAAEASKVALSKLSGRINAFRGYSR